MDDCADRAKSKGRIPATCWPAATYCSCNRLCSPDSSSLIESLVFLPAACVKVSFGCPKCSHCQWSTPKLDGYEFGVLRKTETIAFSYELLYAWTYKHRHGGIPWHSSWRDTVEKYEAATVQNKIYYFRNFKKHFREATFDFIQLQNIDYSAAFQCPHNDGLIVDGITLGFHKDQASFAVPWEALGDGNHFHKGSSFDSRIFLQQKDIRFLLLMHCSNKGLADEDFLNLTNMLHALPGNHPGKTLLPFIFRHAFDDASKDLFYCLATTGPVCQVLKPVIYSFVEEKLLAGRCMTQNEDATMNRHCPHLHRFLKPFLHTFPLPNHIKKLLAALLEVCQLIKSIITYAISISYWKV